MNVLGISAFYHDSAACLVRDGEVVAAAQEERFTRKKHDHRFPKNAIAFCLSAGGITTDDLQYVAFYERPFLKFERLLETYLAYAPRGIASFLQAMPVWLKEKLWMQEHIASQLDWKGPILFPEHHESHAASAFYPSPFEEAAILTMDGVGEWTTTSYGMGEGSRLTLIADIRFPHSLGLLYSAFTYYTGFKVNSGEYKVMGLAPYGEPRYKDLILNELVEVKPDGSFQMNMEHFDYCTGLTMTNEKFHKLFGGPPRKPESPLTQKEMDLARSVQEVTEEIVCKMSRHIRKETGKKYLCLAGGVALNCVVNGKLLRSGLFEDIWIQPAAGDAGGALGAALFTWHQYLSKERVVVPGHDSQKGSYLGPEFTNREILDYLENGGIPFEHLEDCALMERVADLIADQMVIGWVEGRMEFGPRALGARSIIGDARSPTMQAIMNLKIKFRESFRPFAPSVLMEKIPDYFELDRPTPYMLLVADVKEQRRRKLDGEEQRRSGLERLHAVRSDIPAVTHVDCSARIQSVHKETNPLFHRLLSVFDEKHGCAVVINTSFNVRGEPIVCTPQDAYRCFMRTNMDYLVMGNYLVDKRKQESLRQDSDWRHEFESD